MTIGSLFLLTPIPFSLYFHDEMVGVFLLCSGLGAVIGVSLVTIFIPDEELGYRDGFAVVVLSWLGLAFIGAFPYYFCGKIPSFVDCLPRLPVAKLQIMSADVQLEQRPQHIGVC